jgi:hypothetical protein
MVAIYYKLMPWFLELSGESAILLVGCCFNYLRFDDAKWQKYDRRAVPF